MVCLPPRHLCLWQRLKPSPKKKTLRQAVAPAMVHGVRVAAKAVVTVDVTAGAATVVAAVAVVVNAPTVPSAQMLLRWQTVASARNAKNVPSAVSVPAQGASVLTHPPHRLPSKAMAEIVRLV